MMMNRIIQKMKPTMYFTFLVFDGKLDCMQLLQLKESILVLKEAIADEY